MDRWTDLSIGTGGQVQQVPPEGDDYTDDDNDPEMDANQLPNTQNHALVSKQNQAVPVGAVGSLWLAGWLVGWLIDKPTTPLIILECVRCAFGNALCPHGIVHVATAALLDDANDDFVLDRT